MHQEEFKMLHSRIVEFKFLGATDHQPSRVSLHDRWHEERIALSLSGADMIKTVVEHLESKGVEIVSYGYTNQSASRGVIVLSNFDKRIK